VKETRPKANRMANDDVAHGGASPLFTEQGRAAVEFQALIETLPAAIYIATLEDESRTLYMSPQAEQLFGLPASELQPARVREMLHPDDRAVTVAAFTSANDVGAPATLEYRILRPDGSVVWLEDTSLVLPGAPGEPRRVQGYLLDISERKRLEEALLQSQ
jgi:PAS domain S-box-containing protein